MIVLHARLDNVSERVSQIHKRINNLSSRKEIGFYLDNLIGTSLDRKRNIYCHLQSGIEWQPKFHTFLYLFTSKNRPHNVAIAYDRCHSKPELHLLDSFREDGKSCAKVR